MGCVTTNFLIIEQCNKANVGLVSKLVCGIDKGLWEYAAQYVMNNPSLVFSVIRTLIEQ
jgi:hypothetical protein